MIILNRYIILIILFRTLISAVRKGILEQIKYQVYQISRDSHDNLFIRARLYTVSISQSVNQSIRQSVNVSIRQSVNLSISQFWNLFRCYDSLLPTVYRTENHSIRRKGGPPKERFRFFLRVFSLFSPSYWVLYLYISRMTGLRIGLRAWH